MVSCLTALSSTLASALLSLSAQPLLAPPILALPLAAPLLAQSADSVANEQPVENVTEQIVRPLPGQLNNVAVFNSNSPELVAEPGILLSTFPPEGMATPTAHLNYAFEGRFDVFAHHVYKAADYDEAEPKLLDSLYLGVLIHNPGDEPVTIRTLSGASYLSQPDAPFISLPPFVPFNPRSPVFAGPGSRGMGDILQGRRSNIFPPVVTIAPGESELYFNQPIPIRELVPPINGRSTLALLESSGPVYVASLAQQAELDDDGQEIAPSQASWESLLQTGRLAGPRDREPTPLPLAEGASLIYGRVAGVSLGSQWQATLVDPTDEALANDVSVEEAQSDDLQDSESQAGESQISELPSERLTIPASGNAFAYGISLLYGGTMGTGQIQTAEMAVRYPDTAYQAHGNYGVRYDLTLPLHNPTDVAQTVDVIFQTALKEETLSQGGLRFLEPPAAQTFFRGPVQVRYQDDSGLPRVRNIHLVQRRGEKGQPLATVTLAPNETRTVGVDLLYPADSTPPQVLTVQTR
ncbi:MAG: DUF3370 domain-containing protein [Cyanobacteria bacterium P01_D01_bin.105]